MMLRAFFLMLSAAVGPATACGSRADSSGDAAAPPDAFFDALAEPDASNDAVCVTDQDCNNAEGDSAAQHGMCFEGFCFCAALFYPRRTNGKCWPIPPPSCSELGGQCQTAPPECSAGTLEGEFFTNRTCGDAGLAVCCVAEASCRGPDDFTCCASNGAMRAPICVNGWRTCPQNSRPTQASCG